MCYPNVFVTEREEDCVCKLKMSLYGLKQLSRCCTATIESSQRNRFCTSASDSWFYVGGDGF